jgi:hypothetical protein
MIACVLKDAGDFITERLILGAMPIKSKFGAGGDHLSNRAMLIIST